MPHLAACLNQPIAEWNLSLSKNAEPRTDTAYWAEPTPNRKAAVLQVMRYSGRPHIRGMNMREVMPVNR